MDGRHRVRWFFHATVIVEDYDTVRDGLGALVGLHILEDTVIEDPAINRRGGMTWIGDNSLEIAHPLRPGTGTALTLERMGPGFQLVAVQVEDMDATVAHLEACGANVTRTHDHIALTHPKDAGGVFFEWFTGELEFDPRFGGEIPAPTHDPILSASRMAWVGALVDDPLATATRAAELLGTEVTFEAPDAPVGSPMAGVSLVDNTLALFARPTAESSLELWGVRHERARSHALAVEVDDLDGAAEALADRGVALVRRTDSMLVVDPAATGAAPIVVVDELLPGDPRR